VHLKKQKALFICMHVGIRMNRKCHHLLGGRNAPVMLTKRDRIVWVVLAGALSCATIGTAAVAAAEPASAEAGFLNTVAAVRQLTDEQAKQGLPVRLRGVVTCVGRGAFFLDDGNDAIYVQVAEGLIPVRVCDLVAITGKTCEGAYDTDIELQRAEVLGQGTLPAPKVVSFADLDSGAMSCRLVQVEGVVRAQWRYLSAREGALTLLVDRSPLEVGIDLVDGEPFDFGIGARVRVVGIACGRWNPGKQLISSRIAAYREDVHVVESPPADPFDRPLKSAAKLFRSGQHTDPEAMVRIQGVVHYAQGRWLFLRDDTGALRISTQEGVSVNRGTRVEAVGFPGRVGSVSVLEDALVRPIGQGSSIVPRSINVRQIFTKLLDADLVTLEATLRGSAVTANDWTLICQQGDDFFRAKWQGERRLIGAPGGRGGLAHVPWQIGSRLRLSGVVMLEGEVTAGSTSRPEGFSLLIRAPEEIELLTPPPWWDARKLGILSGLLALVGGAVTLWVWQLRREVHRRGTALAEVMAREAQLTERQRIGRELHDTFAQGLTGLGYELMAMARALKDPAKIKQHLDRAFDLLRRTREESRRGILNIRAAEIETKDLPTFLSDSLALLLQDSSVELEFSVSEPIRPLAAAVQSNLIRIAQEAAANTLRHAQATRLRLELAFEEQGVRLVITDDGIGFDVAACQRKQGQFGLCSMRERAQQIGATLNIDSQTDAGARVFLWIPASAENRGASTGSSNNERGSEIFTARD
jgi:signal transduction histidine kinase